VSKFCSSNPSLDALYFKSHFCDSGNRQSFVSTEKNIFQCELCQEEHTIPKSGFKVKKRLQSGLEIQFNTLKLTPVFNECKTVIKRQMKR